VKFKLTAFVVAGLAVVALTGCEEEPSGTEATQPKVEVEYSPTRDTINFWSETWGQDPEKLSYVYIQLADGVYGYFVMKGLPVSYCATLEEPYEIYSSSYGNLLLPAKGIDDAYYTGAGSCNRYYGIEASTGSYVDFTTSANQNFFLFDQPMELPGDLVPLGETEL
jgi:hypothetical protein